MKTLQFLNYKKIGKNNDVGVFSLFRYIGIFPIAADMVILTYPKDSELSLHKDVVNGFKCYRFNLTLNTGTGGELICDNTIYRSKFFNIFRPDQNLHGVSRVEDGNRIVFSLGIGIKE